MAAGLGTAVLSQNAPADTARLLQEGGVLLKGGASMLGAGVGWMLIILVVLVFVRRC